MLQESYSLFYLYMLFCLDCLMQTIRITTSRHDTSGKLIDDQNLIIFYNIILITEHQIVCTSARIILCWISRFSGSARFSIWKNFSTFFTPSSVRLTIFSFSFTTKSPVSSISSPMMASSWSTHGWPHHAPAAVQEYRMLHKAWWTYRSVRK